MIGNHKMLRRLPEGRTMAKQTRRIVIEETVEVNESRYSYRTGAGAGSVLGGTTTCLILGPAGLLIGGLLGAGLGLAAVGDLKAIEDKEKRGGKR